MPLCPQTYTTPQQYYPTEHEQRTELKDERRARPDRSRVVKVIAAAAVAAAVFCLLLLLGIVSF